MVSPRRAVLREATARQHQRVDALIEGANTFGDLAAYGDHLQRMHLFHRRFDNCLISDDGDVITRWQLGHRVAWLSEDLQALFLPPFRMSGPPVVQIPLLTRPAQRLGALYVLIGSALGAALLVKRLGTLGVTPEKGGQYLSKLASSRLWSEFLPELENAQIDTEKDLIIGATETFDFLIEHLEERQGA